MRRSAALTKIGLPTGPEPVLSPQVGHRLCHFDTFLAHQEVAKVVPLGEVLQSPRAWFCIGYLSYPSHGLERCRFIPEATSGGS
jgi:hypothetical protein